MLSAAMAQGVWKHAGFDSLKSISQSEEGVLSNLRMTFTDRGKIKVTIKNLIASFMSS